MANASDQEVELKLALLPSQLAGLAARLGKAGPLAGLKPSRQDLHSVYYDTPDLVLYSQRAALRVRRLQAVRGSDPARQVSWVQTLKTANQSESALSARGEWEQALTHAKPQLAALPPAVWAGIDPDGSVFAALQPCFVTHFNRTAWQVTTPDGSVMEVALDIGTLQAGQRRAPIAELELELRSGRVAALFDVAQALARQVAVLPLSQSKAQRGFALAQGRVDQPVSARAPMLAQKPTLAVLAQTLLRDTLGQFLGNLHGLLRSDEPELVHQARVGWRRFKSTQRLLRPITRLMPLPDMAPLQPLLDALGNLRDLDVARLETLPGIEGLFVAHSPQSGRAWQALQTALHEAADSQRQAARAALLQPEAGAVLLAMTQAIEQLTQPGGLGELPDLVEVAGQADLRPWARRRIKRLRTQLKAALVELAESAAQQSSGSRSTHRIAPQLERQHRARILAKRLRYGVDMLQPYLPPRRARRWLVEAAQLQQQFGQARDLRQALALAAQHHAAPALLAFLRGYISGVEASVPVLPLKPTKH